MSDGVKGRRERWQQVERRVDELLELDPGRRRRGLEALARADPELHREVAEFLDACDSVDSAGSFVDVPLGRAAPHLLEELASEPWASEGAPAAHSGLTLGPYRLLRPIGHGGMATVYLAERADGAFEHRVAVKVLSPAAVGAGGKERFRTERQILAGLDHPNIARLLDGGETPDGLPYLVMELVEGEPVDAYCGRRKLPVEERLRLFLGICSAVAYAHRNLVVHRDLKPSNVLVTPEADVRVLDFGIAKLLEGKGDPALTRFGYRVATPAYAAPEQLAGESVTTATDVYSLGLLLFRLLTGSFPPEAQSSGPRGVVPPSGAADPDTAHRLRGDLDAIVLQAVREEPEERYASAEQLGDDVRRHLEGLPVLAQAPTWPYLVRKLMARHRKAVAATALLALSLVAGLAGTSWQAHVAGRERTRAETEAARADRVTEYLIGLFERARPIRSGRSTAELSARELLARSADAMKELEEEPVTRAALLAALGRVYTSLGEYGEARSYLDRALRLAESSELHPEGVADVLHYRGALHLAEREPVLAEEVLRRAAELRREHLGERAPELARTGLLLSRALRAQDRLREALEVNDEALASLERELGRGHPETWSALSDRASLVAQTGRLEVAESIYRDILERLGELPEADEMRRSAVIHDLAFTLKRQGRLGEAEAMYREALAIMDERLGKEHPHTLQMRANLASVLDQRGKFDETEAVLREVVRGARGVFPEGHWRIGSNLVGGLGEFLMRHDRCRDAEPVLREGLSIWRAALGPDHDWTRRAEIRLGACLVRLGEAAEGRELLEAGLGGLEGAGTDSFDRFERLKLGQIAEILDGWNLDEASRRLRALVAQATG